MLDLRKYLIGIDVWEGALDINEALLLAADIRYIFIRMNDTRGGLHLDENFLNQWKQAEGSARAPYFVVAPWNTAKAQLDFIYKHLPAGCKVVALDVELKGTDPAQYSVLLHAMIADLKRNGIKVVIYTGPWCASFVNPWPKGVDYWWGRYPYYLYPDSRQEVSWEWLKARIALMSWNPGVAPDHIAVWQASADRYMPPGCANRAMDINIMPVEDFERIFKSPILVTQPAFLYKGTTTARDGLFVRAVPTMLNNVPLRKLPLHAPVTVYEKVDGWGKINRDKPEWVSLAYIKLY